MTDLLFKLDFISGDDEVFLVRVDYIKGIKKRGGKGKHSLGKRVPGAYYIRVLLPFEDGCN
jgi:hypothetical protein